MEKYPCLKEFSKSVSIPAENLVEAFEIEKKYHEMILSEKIKSKRVDLYQQLYSTVHPIYKRNLQTKQSKSKVLARKALLFKKELKNKSILEVGCGDGAFLISCYKIMNNIKLCGIDVTIPSIDVIKQYPEIEFINADITDFRIDHKFDVIYSNHVLEHMVYDDLITHLESLKRALLKGGTLIINMPNRLFGPSDVTRIIDFSYTGKTPALGSHFNELTYSELIHLLENYGFENFRTVFPHIKLRHFFRFFRMSPAILCKIEKSRVFMDLLHKIKYKGSCIAKFEVSIICKKN